MAIVLIAAVARNGVIGRDGHLPWHLPGDLRRFKETTMGHTLVMGRRTYQSIGRPLPGRTTVVVTRQPDWDPGHPQVLVANSIEQALETAATVGPDIYVVGGADVYRQAMDLADRMILTEVDADPLGDTYFPHVDWNEWRQESRLPGDGFRTVTYSRL